MKPRRTFDGLEVIEPYRPRFITEAQLTEALNLYHLARTALSGRPDQGRLARMTWACDALVKAHPEIGRGGAYKDLSAALEGY